MAFYDIVESEIPVKYGMINLRQERESARHSLRYIVSDFNDIKSTYFNLGFHLDEFIRCKYYEDFGYTTFKEFCVENLPLDYSSVNRCISVYNMTCQRQNGSLTKTNQIKEEYKDYSYSQLVEMVSMDDKQRKQVKPDMSVRQLRDLKTGKNNSTAPAPVVTSSDSSSSNCDVATIDDSFFTLELVHEFIKKKYRNCEIGQLSYTQRCIWFQHNGKQYKITFNVSDIKGVNDSE